MKTRLILLIFLSSFSISYAQFTSEDYELAKANFTRNYESPVFKTYLNSSDQNKVAASLLSIAHSADTNFVNDIIKLNYDESGDYIAFALGQIGYSKTSIKYLLDKIYSPQNKFEKECFDALGKIFTVKEYQKLCEDYLDNKISQTNYFALTIANAAIRGLEINTKLRAKVLIKIIGKGNLDNKFYALYALYRSGGSRQADKYLLDILSMKDEEILFPHKIYALSCFRRVESFPGKFDLVKHFINHRSWQLRTEAARTFIYYNFTNQNEIDEYLALLNDVNPNVSRQAAISIKLMKPNGNLKNHLIHRIEEFLDENLLTNNSFGELLLSYSELTDADILLLIEKYKNKLDQNFILLLLTKLNTNCDLKLKYLSKFEPVTNDIVVNWTTALISMHDSLYNSDKYKNLVLKSLASDSPEMVNIVATNLDSEFIQNNLNEIKIILKKYITEYSNNPDFLETTVAIINLAPGLGEDFSNNLFTELSESKLPGVINAIAGITGENIPFQKTNRRFDIFWEFAFNYSAIKFTTNKGEFTIKLYPEIAPVTVGNLLYLSHKGFYNNVSFHRVVPNFVIQTGDTSGTGWRGPGYDIISEFSFLPFEEGYVGMASAGKDTEGSQWFVMHSNFPHLNGRYTNFGKVISGFDTVSIIDQDDFIISAELIKN